MPTLEQDGYRDGDWFWTATEARGLEVTLYRVRRCSDQREGEWLEAQNIVQKQFPLGSKVEAEINAWAATKRAEWENHKALGLITTRLHGRHRVESGGGSV